jgi:transcriptional regulator with XRE-family HTH domain
MDARAEIREFLITRRAKLTPEQVGLPDFGGRRRVAGLRREEVALVAGISVDYYTRLERGNTTGVSESVLDGVSRALQLDETEHAHLHDLLRAANAPSRQAARSKPRPQGVPASMQLTIDAMTDAAVLVQNGHLDVVASNALGAALYSPMLDHAHGTPNFGRFVFLEPRARTFYNNWDDAARQTVAILRTEAGRAPRDRTLSNLVGELSTRDETFRTLWAAHNVREHRSGTKSLHHPVVGDIDVSFEGMQLASAPGLLLLAYITPPGTESRDKMQLLANWSATHNATHSADVAATPTPAQHPSSD